MTAQPLPQTRSDEQPALPGQIQEALRSLSSAPELRPILASIAASTRSATEAAVAVIVMFRDDGSLLVEAAGVNGHPAGAKDLILHTLGSGESPMNVVLRTGRPLVIPDVPADRRFGLREEDPHAHVASMVVVPLFDADRVVGTLTVCFQEPNEVGSEVLDLLAAFSHLIVRTVADERSRTTISGLEETGRRKTALLGTIVHELRAPIQASIGFVATVLRHWDRLSDGEKKELLKRVVTNAEEEAHLVDGLLDLSRVEMGHTDLHPVPIDLSAVIRDRVADLAPLFDEHQIVVVVPEKLDTFADPEALTTVLSNLLTNAIKFSPSGTTIEVEAVPDDVEVIVSVRDQGPGIEEAEQLRIFEPLYQSRRNTNHRRGAGLGLAMVERYVGLLGGRIWVESTLGTGSTFSFTVPRSSPGEEISA